MLALARPFVEMCLLRLGPQDLPASPFLLGVSVAAYVGLGVLVTALHYPFLTAVAISVTGTLIFGLLAYALLSVRGVAGRFFQTGAALAGTGAVLEAVALPLVALLEAGEPAADAGSRAGSGAGAILVIPWLAFLVWSWVVGGHILRHALSVRLPAGIGLSIALFWLSTLVIHQLFGDP